MHSDLEVRLGGHAQPKADALKDSSAWVCRNLPHLNRHSVAGSILGGTVISFGLKLLFNRSRPDIPSGIQVFTASFLSSHAMLTAVTYLTLGAPMTRAASSRLKAYFMGRAVFLTVVVGTRGNHRRRQK